MRGEEEEEGRRKGRGGEERSGVEGGRGAEEEKGKERRRKDGDLFTLHLDAPLRNILQRE